jgi:hypothetical protein
VVTVTRATLAVKAGWLMRSLLRHNLSDPASRTGVDWIFKNTPQKELDSYPVIIIDTVFDTVKGNVNYTKRARTNLTYIINVWAEKINDKHSLVDSIVAVLEDNTKHDEDTKTLGMNNIGILSIKVEDNDEYTEKPLITYNSTIVVDCVFSGK